MSGLANDVGVSERTLRRAAATGLIRGERTSPYKLHVSMRERSYVRSHWNLIAAIRGILRTEPTVRWAVLFGSVARGDDLPTSDIDLVVGMTTEEPGRIANLSLKLGDATAREVQVVPSREIGDATDLAADVAVEGRVLVDRDGDWGSIRQRWTRE